MQQSSACRAVGALGGAGAMRAPARLLQAPRLLAGPRYRRGHIAGILLGRRQRSTDAREDEAPRARRSMLYVPGSSSKMLKKSLESPADALCYDLEDSVAVQRKGEARSMVVDALNAAEPGRHERFVRVNSLPTGLTQDDLEAVLSSDKLDGIVIPKVHSADDIKTVTGLIDQHARSPEQAKRLRIIASIESALAIMNLQEFASEDFCADTGIVRTDSRIEMLHARSAIVLAAKAYKLQAIDMVCVKVKDLDVLQDECTEGRRLGFDGKQAIHPGQIEIIQSTFVPSEAEVARAVAVIEANVRSTQEGKGAFTFDDGLMIDAPMVRANSRLTLTAQILQADAIIARAKAAKMSVSWTGDKPPQGY